MSKKAVKSGKKPSQYLRKSRNYKKILVDGTHVSASTSLVKIIAFSTEPKIPETETLKLEKGIDVVYVAEGELLLDINTSKDLIKSVEKALKTLEKKKG